MCEEQGTKRQVVLQSELQCLILLKRFSRTATRWAHQVNGYSFLYGKLRMPAVLSFAGTGDIPCRVPPRSALLETLV